MVVGLTLEWFQENSRIWDISLSTFVRVSNQRIGFDACLSYYNIVLMIHEYTFLFEKNKENSLLSIKIIEFANLNTNNIIFRRLQLTTLKSVSHDMDHYSKLLTNWRIKTKRGKLLKKQ